MMLLKAAASTYDRVVRHGVHAFHKKPLGVLEDQTVLLSKNRIGAARFERQVQYVARIKTIRPATPQELERLYPGVNAGQRWKYLVELYSVTRLQRPINLQDVPGLDATRFETAQAPSRFTLAEVQALFKHFAQKEKQLLCDLLNADPAEEVRSVA